MRQDPRLLPPTRLLSTTTYLDTRVPSWHPVPLLGILLGRAPVLRGASPPTSCPSATQIDSMECGAWHGHVRLRSPQEPVMSKNLPGVERWPEQRGCGAAGRPPSAGCGCGWHWAAPRGGSWEATNEELLELEQERIAEDEARAKETVGAQKRKRKEPPWKFVLKSLAKF